MSSTESLVTGKQEFMSGPGHRRKATLERERERKIMKRSAYWAAGFLLLIAFGFFWGCSSNHFLLTELHTSNPVLAKRVEVVPFIDETHLGGGLGAKFTEEFVSRLKKIPSVVLVEKPLDVSKPSDDMKSPRFGIVTPKDYIRKAEDRGMNILITGVLNPIDVTMKRAGIWPFRKNSYFQEISMVVNLIDLSSGAVMFTRLESKTYSSSEEDFIGNEKQFMEELMNKHMPEIVKKEVSAISDVLEDIPWVGKVLSVEGDTIRVDGGQDIGVKGGQVFRVFSQGESVPSLSGRLYPVRSKEVGRIEIVSVGDTDSVAKPVSGGPFAAGQPILLKD
jgi:hypothetical protein